MATGWNKLGGRWYLLDRKNGDMKTGWAKDSGKWYFLDKSSGAMKTGWIKDGGNWYYLDNNGVMASNKWVGDYYLQQDGTMAVSKWIGNYYVGSDGAWVKNPQNSGSGVPDGRTIYEQNKTYIQQVLDETNKIRAAAGVSPLVLDEKLCILACTRAAEITYNECFSHTRPNGKRCFTILDENNYKYGCAGENIAAGQDTPAAVVNDWAHSEGHYKNMVDPAFNKIGVGVVRLDSFSYGIAWVQMFTD